MTITASNLEAVTLAAATFAAFVAVGVVGGLVLCVVVIVLLDVRHAAAAWRQRRAIVRELRLLEIRVRSAGLAELLEDPPDVLEPSIDDEDRP